MHSSNTGDLCEHLYTDYRGWLISWLGKRLRCNDKASDIVQDLFCRLSVVRTFGTTRGVD